MRSSIIGKIAKARRYAQERERVSFLCFTARLRGEHGHHTITFEEGKWDCTCPFFSGHGLCSHTLALQYILGEMLPSTPLTPGP